jgi:hypothetical protein
MGLLGCGPVKYNLQQKHESRNDSMAFDCSLFERQQALFEKGVFSLQHLISQRHRDMFFQPRQGDHHDQTIERAK